MAAIKGNLVQKVLALVLFDRANSAMEKGKVRRARRLRRAAELMGGDEFEKELDFLLEKFKNSEEVE